VFDLQPNDPSDGVHISRVRLHQIPWCQKWTKERCGVALAALLTAFIDSYDRSDFAPSRS
jgi:hypothetical protein